MQYLKNIWKISEYRRIFILMMIVFVMYLLREMLNLFLLTFILTYLMYRLQNALIFGMKKIVKLQQPVVAIVLYMILLAMLIYGVYAYGPKMIKQSNYIIEAVVESYENLPKDNNLVKFLQANLEEFDMKAYINTGIKLVFESIDNVINAFIASVLSLFFLIERKRVRIFTAKFADSKAATVYKDIVFIGKKFLNSFGKVIEAQVLIAMTNTILSVIVLTSMGFAKYIFGLAIMIFVLGLIPVAGVIISVFPLALIAYSIGGFTKVVYVIIMIVIVHLIETYFLNPKFMSLKTKLPIFYTLLILIVSEKLIGIWGLIIGIPIFIFVLELLDVDFTKDKKTHKEIG